MELIWGQPVTALDVWLGRLQGVMLVQDSATVTHLVVKRGLGRGRLYVIPVESIKKCVSEAIYTEMPLEEALQQPTLRRLDNEQFIVALTHKTRVLTADGKRLRLRGLRVSGRRRSTGWLVVSTRMSKRRFLLPFDEVTEIATGKLTLAMGSSGLRALPAYRRDSDIEADLWERISTAFALRQGDLAGINVTVDEGAVAIRGNVESPNVVQSLRDAARDVRGATGLLLDVASDADLELEVAAALAQHTRGNGGPLRVSSQLGRVELLGHLPGEDECALLVRVANAVPGVRGVELASL